MLGPVLCYQVYLVVGGYPDIASTELLIDGMLAWTMTGPLPRPLWGLQVVSITVSNKIIATGRIKFKHFINCQKLFINQRFVN